MEARAVKVRAVKVRAVEACEMKCVVKDSVGGVSDGGGADWREGWSSIATWSMDGMGCVG